MLKAFRPYNKKSSTSPTYWIFPQERGIHSAYSTSHIFYHSQLPCAFLLFLLFLSVVRSPKNWHIASIFRHTALFAYRQTRYITLRRAKCSHRSHFPFPPVQIPLLKNPARLRRTGFFRREGDLNPRAGVTRLSVFEAEPFSRWGISPRLPIYFSEQGNICQDNSHVSTRDCAKFFRSCANFSRKSKFNVG